MNDNNTRSQVKTFSCGKALVLAPAGCGKTELLSQRISYALESNVNHNDMLCITFTNRAAINMRERNKKTVLPFIGTFHQFGTKFLKANKLLNINTRVLDGADYEDLCNEAIEDLSSDAYTKGLIQEWKHTIRHHKKFLNQVCLYQAQKNFGIDPLGWTPENCTRQDHSYIKLVSRIVEKIHNLKNEYNCIDYNDILLMLTCALKNKTATKMHSYTWIQVDEVQDLSPIQWRIINLLTDQVHKPCVVLFGDYQQSIYSFLDAKIKNLGANTVGFTTFELYNNFRTKSTLVNAFNHYTEKAFPFAWRLSTTAVHHSNIDEHKLAVIKVPGPIANETKTLLKRLNTRGYFNGPENVGILVRDNAQANNISKQLHELCVPHFKMSGTDLFNNEVVKDAFAFANILHDTYNWLAWTRLWDTYSICPTHKQNKNILFFLTQQGFSFLEYVKYNDGFYSLTLTKKLLHTGRIVIFDTETTGLDPKSDEIIQIAAVEVINGQKLRTFERFIKINTPVGESEKIHHISDETLKKHGVPLNKAMQDFFAFVNNDALYAHNAKFDTAFILECTGVSLPTIDTIDIAKRILPNEKTYKLEHLIKVLGTDGVNSHNAIDDVIATANVLIALCNKFSTPKMSEIQLNSLAKFNIHLRNIFINAINTMNQTNITKLFKNFINDTIIHEPRYKILVDDIKPNLENLYRHMDEYFSMYLNTDILYTITNLYSQKQESDLITDKDTVIISTVHKAKGLEFNTVYIPSCNNAVSFPAYAASLTHDGVEEEKRLFYVALTRAKDNIIISYHTERENNKQTFATHPSPFINYLDQKIFNFI